MSSQSLWSCCRPLVADELGASGAFENFARANIAVTVLVCPVHESYRRPSNLVAGVCADRAGSGLGRDLGDLAATRLGLRTGVGHPCPGLRLRSQQSSDQAQVTGGPSNENA